MVATSYMSTEYFKCVYSKLRCAELCLITQLCSTLCDPMDYSPPGSSVHVILQNTEAGCISYSRDLLN